MDSPTAQKFQIQNFGFEMRGERTERNLIFKDWDWVQEISKLKSEV